MTKNRVEPHAMPGHSIQHLVWRLASVSAEEPNGWFLFDGLQIQTIVEALKLKADRTAEPVKVGT